MTHRLPRRSRWDTWHMTPARVLNQLESERLLLRPSRVGDAVIFRQLWTERDPRVPAHRKISSAGRPTVEDIAAKLRTELEEQGPRLLTVERKGAADVIGYCGLTVYESGSPEELELAYELVRAAHGHGYATEASRAVVAWAREAGYRRLWAGVWDWNTVSRRILHKLEFRETGRVEPHSEHGHTLQ